MAQKLTPTARRKKATRDKKYAMTEWGKYKKRTAQKKKCKKGYDYDHRLKKCVKSSKNRAGGKGGTKNEKTKKSYILLQNLLLVARRSRSTRRNQEALGAYRRKEELANCSTTEWVLSGRIY